MERRRVPAAARQRTRRPVAEEEIPREKKKLLAQVLAATVLLTAVITQRSTDLPALGSARAVMEKYLSETTDLSGFVEKSIAYLEDKLTISVVQPSPQETSPSPTPTPSFQ